MAIRERLTAWSAGSVRTWLHFSLGATLLVVIATSIDFANTAARGSFGAEALRSFLFALELVASAAFVATLPWGVLRLIRGKLAAPYFGDWVLWNAYVVVALVLMLRLLR
ncbi:MAG TPA: hypothetical protein VHP37_22410 [Burkholderiales bacterium]|nr:hypothetical protein [Burkholderiales bacterium]